MMTRIPILKLRDCLIVSIQWELDDQTALTFQEDLLDKLHTTSARGVVLDLRRSTLSTHLSQRY